MSLALGDLGAVQAIQDELADGGKVNPALQGQMLLSGMIDQKEMVAVLIASDVDLDARVPADVGCVGAAESGIGALKKMLVTRSTCHYATCGN